jgi:hypothetical protein
MFATETRLLSGVKSALSYFLAAVFLFSAVSKLFSHAQFDQFVLGLPPLSLLGPDLSRYLIVLLELSIATFVLLRPTRVLGGFIAFLTLFFFTVILIVGASVNPGTLCGCFGEAMGEGSAEGAILRNIVLLCVSVAVFVAMDRHERSDE